MRNMITLVGLGPGDPGMISLAAMEALTESTCLWLRTSVHPSVDWLRKKELKFETFDLIYQEAKDFQEVYRKIANRVIEIGKNRDIVYALPGHPLMAEKSVDFIMEEAETLGIEIRIIPGISFLDAVTTALRIDPVEGLVILDGLDLDSKNLQPGIGTVLVQAYSKMVLSDLKLTLMECYQDDHPVVAVTAAGIPGEERLEHCPLYLLDRLDNINHLTSIYVPPVMNYEFSVEKNKYPLDPLVETMEILRGVGGCPWDREQTHTSLRKYLLEESYELIEAINSQDMDHICEELGDILLQVVFHAQIASENGSFEINDVIEEITEKMIRRHPHVFGNVKVENSAEVAVNWEAIKKTEKKIPKMKSILDGVPESFSSLLKAQKIQVKAAQAGFDWDNYTGALEKVFEELAEIDDAIKSKNRVHIESEIGDAIFSLVNLARLLDISAETALAATLTKFKKRFSYIEEQVLKSGQSLSDFNIEKKNIWWEESKKKNNNKNVE
ncbi:MAG: nucleoside triphosphate pyrophosphohydrolase [Peptococcaceae bacterium]|nr:nucleoside triphosphate pyrophosphohydrolase [Peptococcaceae bacterium]